MILSRALLEIHMPTPQNPPIALITGASSGIGWACATRLAQAGYHLILVARRLSELQQLAQQLQQDYRTLSHCLAIDVSDASAVREQLQHLPMSFQAIDVLINNAGLALGLEPLQQGNSDDWDRIIDVNVKGLLYVTKAVLPGMLARNHGHIINMGSIAGLQVYPGGNVYCASKHAVGALSDALRLDLLGKAIRVTCIEPGMVHTEFSQVRFKGDKTRAEAVYQGLQPLTPEDIADTVWYAVQCPPHVNISHVVVMPTAQASATQVARG